MNKTAILFDVDGVVIQAKPFTFALDELHGMSKDFMAPFFNNQFKGCLVGASDLKEELKTFLPAIPWTGGVEDFLDFWFQAENCPDPELLSEIARLRESGYFVAVATNQEKYRVQFMREQMAFGSMFDQVFVSCEIGYKKPMAEFYDVVTRNLRGCGIESIVFFDDRADNVEGAAGAGWDARLYSSIEDFRTWAKQAANN